MLDVKNLAVEFETSGGKAIPVRGVSFSVDRGRTLGIVGESGSGKSTLALALTALHSRLVRARISGAVLFEGIDLLSLQDRELEGMRGSRISYVFQNPATALNPTRLVGHQVTAVIRRHRPSLSRPEAKEDAIRWLDRVGIPSADHAFHRYPHEFSGGQQQRIVIAIALSNQPDLLIADEPTSSLDVLVEERMLDLLQELQEALGMAMIFISHDLRLVSRIADETMVMYGGKIAETGDTQAVLGAPKHWYTLALLRSVPDPDGEYSHDFRFEAVPGSPPSALAEISGCPFAPRCPAAQEVCSAEAPPVIVNREAVGQQEAACWFPVGSAAAVQHEHGAQVDRAP